METLGCILLAFPAFVPTGARCLHKSSDFVQKTHSSKPRSRVVRARNCGCDHRAFGHRASESRSRRPSIHANGKESSSVGSSQDPCASDPGSDVKEIFAKFLQGNLSNNFEASSPPTSAYSIPTSRKVDHPTVSVRTGKMPEALNAIAPPNDAAGKMAADEVVSGFVSLPTYRSNEEITGGSGKGVLSSNGIQAWRHSASGVRIVLFKAPGPLTSANIALGTIPISDGGHPHTLEHIIFLGSEKYPSRGYLDTLANRSLADGTNAYTDIDHTVYQACAAGFEGLSSLLPCFIDHVLRPKINEKAFASEVYCIRSDGKESGVVFSEMHGRENTEDDLCACALNKVLLGGTPLAYNSGGMCADIRALTNESIQQYHDDYYCGSNVTVIVGGDEIPPTDLLNSVKPILDDIASTQNYEGKKISWENVMELTPMPPVTRTQVAFPCPDEDIGSVLIGWRGPSIRQIEDMVAIQILLQYLTSTVSAPLQQEFIECASPTASQVYFYTESFLSTGTIVLGFSGVSHKDKDPEQDPDDESKSEKKKMEENNTTMLTSGEFSIRVMDFLKKLALADEISGGLEAVHLMISRAKESFLSGLEEDSHELVPGMLLGEVLYADAFEAVIGSESRGKLMMLEEFYEKSEQFWLNLMKTVLVEAPRIELSMVPDPHLADRLAETDSKLTEERIAKIGLDELKRQGEINEGLISSLKSSALKSDDFPRLPSASNVPRIPYEVSLKSAAHYWQQCTAVDTDFIHVSILVNTSKLSFSQRMLLPFMSRLMFNSDIALDDGSYISYTDSSNAITEVTVATDLSGTFLGYSGGSASECLVKHFATTPKNFSDALRLTLQALFKEEVSKKRLVTVAKNIMADITEDSRDAMTMMSSASSILCHATSGAGSTDIKSLPNEMIDTIICSRPLISLLAEGGRKSEKIRQKCVRMVNETLVALRTLPSSKIFIQITGRSPKELEGEFKDMWNSMRLAAFMKAGKTDAPMNMDEDELVDFSQLPINSTVEGAGLGGLQNDAAKAIGIAGVENCYIFVQAGTNVPPEHRDWAPLLVLCEMLCRMEGPLSDAIRGTGLAYGYGIFNHHCKGYIRASISETTSPVSAWVAMADKVTEIREELENDDCKVRLLMDLDTAKAVRLFALSHSRSTPEGIVKGAIYDSALGLHSSPLRDRGSSEAVEKVTLSDLIRVFDAYVMPLFREGSRVAVLTCSPHITDELTEQFEECKYPIRFEACSGDDLVPKAILDFVRKL